MSIEIHGRVAPGFEPVRDAFADNFARTDEIGAAFALYRDGDSVVDIWAGHRDRKKTLPWLEDTIVPVFSTGKAITALVMAWLVDQGRFAYDDPMTDYWPEFGQNGKDTITIAQALSHQAGLSGPATPMEPSQWFDREFIERYFAAQAPLWPLSEGSGYHPVSFGVLADAIVRRTDPQGRTIGALLKEELAGPRDIDFLVGVPEDQHERAAEHILPPKPPFLGKINPYREAAFLKPYSSPGRRGAAAWRSAELPAANGHGTARAIAELMSVFARGGLLRDERLISEAGIAEALKLRISGEDKVLPFDLAFAAGVMINRKSGHYGPEPQTVGHYGFGGSCGFADPVQGLSGAYVMNRQMDVLVGDERAMALINAAYECV